MPSFAKLATFAAAIATLASTAATSPAAPRLNHNQLRFYERSKRQNAAASAAGLTDVDILQFALTLEHLEAAFYQQGFAKFPASDFAALGLTQGQITDLLGVGASEQTHVTLLQGAIAQTGVQPVAPCTYGFNLTDAKSMVATAAVLENVGASAYLGGGVLLTSPSILGTAASILAIEARHQTFVRAASAVSAAPGAFDTALSPKQVFSLAAPFIQSCPTGSNLALTPFPALAMADAAQPKAAVGQTLNVAAVGSTSSSGNASTVSAASTGSAQFCAFTNGNIVGGTAFSAFTPGTGCTIPGQGELTGLVYVNLVTQAPLTGVLTDDMIVAGPMVLQLS